MSEPISSPSGGSHRHADEGEGFLCSLTQALVVLAGVAPASGHRDEIGAGRGDRTRGARAGAWCLPDPSPSRCGPALGALLVPAYLPVDGVFDLRPPWRLRNHALLLCQLPSKLGSAPGILPDATSCRPSLSPRKGRRRSRRVRPCAGAHPWRRSPRRPCLLPHRSRRRAPRRGRLPRSP